MLAAPEKHPHAGNIRETTGLLRRTAWCKVCWLLGAHQIGGGGSVIAVELPVWFVRIVSLKVGRLTRNSVVPSAVILGIISVSSSGEADVPSSGGGHSHAQNICDPSLFCYEAA